ncbi:MAG: hypothetical protein RLZZ450_5533 [Pseudomonadota bacterium]|jgi:predicted ATPase
MLMTALDFVRLSGSEPTGATSLVAALAIAGLTMFATVDIEPGQAAVRLISSCQGSNVYGACHPGT